MTPEQFIKKWKASTLTERAASQSHFIDLCALLEEPTPSDADPTGEHYAFERGATKTTGGEGWADVWKRGCFAWEYKGKRKDLKTAYAQLQQYAVALENPPLLVVCDMETFEIHTNWTNTVHEVHRVSLEELREAHYRTLLKAVFSDPERLKPGQTRQALTEEAAREFAGLAQRLRGRGLDPQRVAHFVNRLVFCMFAEDVGLLPGKMFQRMLEQGVKRPDQFTAMTVQLFAAMRGGGLVGFEEVAWFNGGLFDDDDAVPMEKADIEQALKAARLDWAEIDPSIFGTLFERGLDPDKRSQLGAHYTDREKIMLIVGPVVVEPLTREWDAQKQAMQGLLERAGKAKSASAATKARNEAQSLYTAFLERLKRFRVLDPACGSGNFLYLALLALKELEHRVNLDAEVLGFQRAFPAVGPEAVLGIEINPYAAELARVSVWIGEIQWMRRNGFTVPGNPILKPLENIECRDALLTPEGTEAEWPEAEVIVGNPPFLGDKKIVGILGLDYVTKLRTSYRGRVGGNADLVCFWFDKAATMIASGTLTRAGLVAPNSIRRGANRNVLDTVRRVGAIFEAWSDEAWVLDGAALRVSIICFGSNVLNGFRLNGESASIIYSDLTSGTVDITAAVRLKENAKISFLGIQKSGPLDVQGTIARNWMSLPVNPNGISNLEILRPFYNGDDITTRPRDVWLIDIPPRLSESDASLFEAPFEHLSNARYSDDPDDRRTLKEARAQARDQHARDRWWEPYWPRPEMRTKIEQMSRYIVSPETPTHTVFAWLPNGVLPDKNLIVIARDDDVTFGVLHSKFHLIWVRAIGSPYGNHPTARRYNSSRVFETFPFPIGLTPNIAAEAYRSDPRAICVAAAAKKLDDLRSRWLNPADRVRRAPEVAPNLPDRLLPVNEEAASILRQRTLTNLYNERPTWLANVHRELDEAVAAAYGWSVDLVDEEVLSRLLALNAERARGPANDAGSR